MAADDPTDHTDGSRPPDPPTPPQGHDTGQEVARDKGDAAVDPRVLELLVCPETRSTLAFHRQAQVLVSPRPKLAYRILNGVPIMVASEARELDDDDPLLKR